MRENLTNKSSAVLIILLMVLINAGVILYFAGQFDKADEKLANQIAQNEQVAKENRQLIARQEQERIARTDQNCEFAERTHLRDVQALRGTYKYLEAAEADPTQKDTILYKLVISGAPRTISEGETDIAPAYCDEQGYGLKEPDPTIPKRPDFLPESVTMRADNLLDSTLRLDNRQIESTITPK